MITWLQNATAKQHRLIFGSLLLVIVVSLVFFPVVQSVGGGQATTSVYQGVDLNDPTVRARFRDATFFAQMTGQRMNENGLVQRVAELALADGLAELELEPLTEVEREFGEDSQREESRRAPDRAAVVRG